MPDPLAKATYETVLSAHLTEIAPALQQLEARIGRAAVGEDAAELQCLQTMRTLLLSGLFDPDLYVKNYPDVPATQMDPLEHYVRRGDRELRIPNAVFFPFYYRGEFMRDLPSDLNTLEHYVAIGEAAGARPNSAFDPTAYIAANPPLAEFVDRPLFHYLKIGRAVADDLSETWAAERLHALLEYVHAHPWRRLLPRAKQSLVAGYGVRGGFDHYRTLIDQPDQAEVHLRPLVDLQDIRQCDALAAYHEVAPAGELFLLPAPVVIGVDPPLAQHVRTRAFFVACLINARVRSASTIIQAGNVALLDYQGYEMKLFERWPEYDPSIFAALGDDAWIITPRGKTASIEIDEAFTLFGDTGNHFGHWICEYLPKYVAASMSGALPPVPVLMEADSSNSLRQALELVIPDGVDIIEVPPLAAVKVRRLWCAPAAERTPSTHDCPEPKRFAAALGEMARRIDRRVGPPTGPEKVFLARGPSFARKMINREAIEAIAQARGFVIAFSEELEFAEQFRLTRNARFVIGPDGSAMYLALFVKPGAKVCMLASHDAMVTMPGRTAPFIPLGVDLTVFTGRTVRLTAFEPDSDYEVDEAAFSQFLDQWLQTPAFGERAICEDPGCLDNPTAA